MCSIGGFISERPLDAKTARSLVEGLVWYGADRGQQSTGAWIQGPGGTRLVKKAVSPSEFTAGEDFDKLFQGMDGGVTTALTHTRQPTSGGRGDKQAQPFRRGEVVTVHNGMYWNSDREAKHWEVEKKHGVDSELVTAFVSSYGAMKLPKLLQNVYGASALGVWDNGKLYLMRSDNPTCYSAFTLRDGNEVVAFASTRSILFSALKHTWLMPSSIRGAETKENVLLLVTPKKLVQCSKKIYPAVLYTKGRGGAYGYGSDFDSEACDLSQYASRFEGKSIAERELKQWEERKGKSPFLFGPASQHYTRSGEVQHIERDSTIHSTTDKPSDVLKEITLSHTYNGDRGKHETTETENGNGAEASASNSKSGEGIED